MTDGLVVGTLDAVTHLAHGVFLADRLSVPTLRSMALHAYATLAVTAALFVVVRFRTVVRHIKEVTDHAVAQRSAILRRVEKVQLLRRRHWWCGHVACHGGRRMTDGSADMTARQHSGMVVGLAGNALRHAVAGVVCDAGVEPRRCLAQGSIAAGITGTQRGALVRCKTEIIVGRHQETGVVVGRLYRPRRGILKIAEVIP